MNGLKIAHAGIDALTDTNPKNFSLYIDGSEDHVLVKEQSRGTLSVSAFSTGEVTHNLGYIPIYMVGVYNGTNYQWLYGNQNSDGYRTWATTSKIFFRNASASSKTFTYIILHDQL